MKCVIKGYRVFGIAVAMMSVVIRLDAMDKAASGVRAVATQYEDLNSKDACGDTPLLRATKELDVAAVQRLLDLRADPNVPDAVGCAAFWYACMGTISEDASIAMRQKKIVQLLYADGADDSKVFPRDLCAEFLEAIISAEIDLLKKVQEVYDALGKGGSVSLVMGLPIVISELVRGYYGDKSAVALHPLKLRSRLKKESWDDYLFKACNARERGDALGALYVGANPAKRHDDCGCVSPLHCAVEMRDDCDLLPLFLQCGADTEVRDARGLTPLHWAVSLNAPETVALLLEHGAHIDVQNNKGETALDIAKRNRQMHLVALLKQHGAKDRSCVIL